MAGRTEADVDAALRQLPSQGSSNGWTNRRNRALLVLSQVAGLRPDSIVELTAGDISVSGGVATIRTPGGTTTLRRDDDVLLCGPCALARWLHALDLTVVQPASVAASVVARSAPLTARSPHLCDGELALSAATSRLPVLPPTDPWGPHRQVTRVAVPAHSTAAVPAQRTTADPRAAAQLIKRTGTLRLSKYADALESGAAQRLRHNLESTVGEFAGARRSN